MNRSDAAAASPTPTTPGAIAESILADKSQGLVLPTNLHALLRRERVDLDYFSTPRALDGRLELLDGRPGIFVNLRERGRDHPRVRFTLAHEIGHFFLHLWRLRRGRPFRDDRIELDDEARADPLEREANEFATEILLPRRCVTKKLAAVRQVDLAFVESLASVAQTSLQATSIRVARLSREALAVLLVNDSGVVEWIVASDEWRKRMLPCSALRRRPLPSGSIAARRLEDFGATGVPLEAWAPRQDWKIGVLCESAKSTPFGRLVLLAAVDSV